MFRFLYAKIICAPYNIYKRHKDAKKKTQIAHRSSDNGWSTQNDQNDQRQVKTDGKRSTQNPIDDDVQQGRNQRTTVPLTITMLIIAGYIAAGALIFHKFEDWTMTQAGYFCFITLGKIVCLKLTKFSVLFFFFFFFVLATIGFGDFVS